MSSALIVIGSGGHAISVANVAVSAGYKIDYFVDPYKTNQNLLNIQVINDLLKIKNMENFSFAIAIGDNFKR